MKIVAFFDLFYLLNNISLKDYMQHNSNWLHLRC